MQLRFTSFAVIGLWRDFHPGMRPCWAHTKSSPKAAFFRGIRGAAQCRLRIFARRWIASSCAIAVATGLRLREVEIRLRVLQRFLGTLACFLGFRRVEVLAADRGIGERITAPGCTSRMPPATNTIVVAALDFDAHHPDESA